MIEAMACGTPVIAFRNGSVPEVIENDVSGFIVDSEEEAAQAVKRAVRLDRRKVREAFERRFTARRMANNYVEQYQQLLRSSWSRNESLSSGFGHPTDTVHRPRKRSSSEAN